MFMKTDERIALALEKIAAYLKVIALKMSLPDIQPKDAEKLVGMAKIERRF